MATTDDYGQGVSVAELIDAPDAEVLARNLANGIVSRGTLRFDSAGARTAALTGPAAPVEGMMSWLRDVNRLHIYDGTTWQPLPIQQSGEINVSFTSLDNYLAPTITFPSVFAAPPRVFVNINSQAGPTARWNGRAVVITATGFRPFLYAGATGDTATWSGIEIQWHAIAR